MSEEELLDLVNDLQACLQHNDITGALELCGQMKELLTPKSYEDEISKLMSSLTLALMRGNTASSGLSLIANKLYMEYMYYKRSGKDLLDEGFYVPTANSDNCRIFTPTYFSNINEPLSKLLSELKGDHLEMCKEIKKKLTELLDNSNRDKKL